MSMEELFPDAEQRAERRAELHARLDLYLDNFVEAEPGNWPIVMRDDLVELHEIVGEVIDLKFARDCDGDQAVIPLFDDRTKGRMTFASVPHPPEDYDGDKAVEYYSAMSQAIHTLSTGASSATAVLTARLSADASKRREERQAEDLITRAREHLAHREVEEAEKLMAVIVGEGAPHPIETKLGRPPRVLIPRDDPRMEQLRYDISKAHDLGGPRWTVTQAIDAMEKADLSDRKVEQDCFAVLREATLRFSKMAFRDESDRANSVAERRRLARKAR